MSVVSYQLSNRVLLTPSRTSAVDQAVDQAPSAPSANLAELPVGAQATISGFGPGLRPDIARRLFDLGFVPGTTVEAARRAPLRDPVIYRVSGVEVALRSSESSSILLAA